MPTIRIFAPVLVALTALVASTSAINCWARAYSPSTNIPFAADCRSLGLRLSLAQGAKDPQTFSGEPVPGPYIRLPKTYTEGTCYAEIVVDGRPFYDIAKLADIGNVIYDIAVQCLETTLPAGTGAGGYEKTGNNHWLEVRVMGKIVHGSGNGDGLGGAQIAGLQPLGPGNGTVGSSYSLTGGGLNTAGIERASGGTMTAKRWVA